jgi:hypothetical protein
MNLKSGKAGFTSVYTLDEPDPARRHETMIFVFS